MNICAATMVRSDRPYEVKEWVNYHKLIGVNKFYIYDDFSEADIKPLFPKNTKWLSSIHDRELLQCKLYEKFMRLAKEDKVDWLLLIDIDEYIVITHKPNLSSFLEEMNNYPAVELQMRNFSPQGNVGDYKPDKSIFDTFAQYYRPSFDVKTLVNINRLKKPFIPNNPHHFIKSAVDCLSNIPTYTTKINFKNKKDHIGYPCNINVPAWINHYPLRDLKQIHSKIKNHSTFIGDNEHKQIDYVLRYLLTFTNPNVYEKFNFKKQMAKLYKKHIENCDWLTT